MIPLGVLASSYVAPAGGGSEALTYRSVAWTGVNSPGSTTVAAPAGLQDGDTMLLCVYANEAVPNTPSGWELILVQLSSGALGNAWIFHRVASSEPSSLALSWSSEPSNKRLVAWVAMTGGGEIVDTESSSPGIVNSVTLPSMVTGASSSAFAIVSAYSGSNVSWSGAMPSPFSEHFLVGNTTCDLWILFGTAEFGDVEETGDLTFDTSITTRVNLIVAAGSL